MQLGDYLIIAAVIAGLLAAVYYIWKPDKRGCCSTCCTNACALKKDSREDYHKVTEGENDENSEGSGKLP